MDSCFEFLKVIQRAFCETRQRNTKSLTVASAQAPEDTSIIATSVQIEDDENQFLLSIQSIRETDARKALPWSTKGTEESNRRNSNLFLACVAELMVRRSNQFKLCSHPLVRSTSIIPAHLSLEKSVEELIVEMEKLNGYKRGDGAESSEDGIKTMVERDLWCKGMFLNAMWDAFWEECICIEEAEQVVCQIEDCILYKLIEEVVAD